MADAAGPALDPAAEPEARLVAGDCSAGLRVAVLAGSFNPPTRAHLGLATAALASGAFDRLLFALSLHIVDKEQVTGAPLADRLRMLELLVAEQPRFAVIVTNRGLYVEQALAVQRAFAPRDLAFVVGFDKIVQIFDPRYYDDREKALGRLFERARFLVAPRDGTGAAGLEALLARPENQPYAARVAWLPLDSLAEREQRLSSTLVRQLLAEGQDVRWAVPEAVARYIKQTDCYGVRRQDQE